MQLAVATLANHDQYARYPFGMSFDEVRDFCSGKRQNEILAEGTSLDKKLFYALRSCEAPHGIHRGRAGYFTYLHFTTDTLYSVFLRIQLNTGWNQQTILALTDDLDAHIVPDFIDPLNMVEIWSYKGRSGKGDVHRCDKRHKYGTYALLKYLEAVIAAQRDSPHYVQRTLWQCTVVPEAWNKSPHVLTAFTPGLVEAAARRFITRHGLKIQGPLGMAEAATSHQRTRSTYATLRLMQDRDETQIQHDLGHAHEDTTNQRYLSDRSSNALKDRKLYKLLEQLVRDMKDYKPTLVESISLAKLRAALMSAKESAGRHKRFGKMVTTLGMNEQAIIQIISPEGQTYIGACRDARHPTWPGHERDVRAEGLCGCFDRCSQCRQAVIFCESLPYICARNRDLKALRHDLNPMDWSMNYEPELAANEDILQRWKIRTEVAEAERRAESGEVVLPLLWRIRRR